MAAARWGAQRSYDNHLLMLEREMLDAVFISVAPQDQARLSMDCLAAGADVLVEKPLGMNAAEARAVSDLATATSRIIMVGFMKRHAPAYRRLKALMADESILGPPVSFNASFAFRPWTDSLRNETFLRLGAIHYVDLVRWLFGEVADVHVQSNSSGSDINIVANLRCTSGAVGSLTLLGMAAWKREHEELTITGNRGFATAANLHRVAVHVEEVVPPRAPTAPGWQSLEEQTTCFESINSPASGGEQHLYLRGFVDEIAHFFECVRTRHPPTSSASDNVNTTILCDRLLAALQANPNNT
jgi:predicted dehydrogenase